jgi:hypothetical protein
MKIASKMMIGSGMPSSQSNNPRPNPMTFSSARLSVGLISGPVSDPR